MENRTVISPPKTSGMAGYLQKKGQINTAWQTRWCVLSADKIFYFKNNEQSKPLGYIPLNQAVIRVRKHMGSSNSILNTILKKTGRLDEMIVFNVLTIVMGVS